MEPCGFEERLDVVCAQLTAEAGATPFVASQQFEDRVRQVLDEALSDANVDFSPPAQGFPDIAVAPFGVEVKFTLADTWRSVANSIFEGSRKPGIEHIYVVFGKMGGRPEVRWGRYDDCVIHVRTSHVPRFEVEIGAAQSLFDTMGVSYKEFSGLSVDAKMEFVRTYARGRLREGERLWWLENPSESEFSLPIAARLYMDLEQEHKRQLRAEATLLCPQVVKPSRAKQKYDDVALYILTYHGVVCSQVRDLFSAGSVAMRADDTRGGNYVERALLDIQDEMYDAAHRMDDALFVEYWGESCPPERRITRWLERADALAVDWRPSEVLFLGRGGPLNLPYRNT